MTTETYWSEEMKNDFMEISIMEISSGLSILEPGFAKNPYNCFG